MFANGFFPTRWIPCEANRRFIFATTWLNETVHKIVRQRRGEMILAMEAGKYEKRASLNFPGNIAVLSTANTLR